MKRTQSKREESDILDSDEQEAIVASLKEQAMKQSITTRNTFCLVFTIVAGIFVFCFIEFSINPWSMVHQMRFEGVIPPLLLQVFYCASACVFATCAGICRYGRTSVPVLLWVPLLLVSVALAIAWLALFWEMGIDVLLLYWLPFGNVAAMVLALYVDKDMISLIDDSEKMEGLKYDLKSA